MSKVFVMLSGGVDSSVVALLLKNQGYSVVGVFMKCWSLDQLQNLGLSKDLYACNWEDDLEDAILVAKKLEIELIIWDFQNEYRQKIIDYMISEYKKGLTPNPDVMCNSLIKFGIFYEKALQNGADFVASGHYARVLKPKQTISLLDFQKEDYNGLDFFSNLDSNKRFLATSLDKLKDQTYFLWKIESAKLSKVLLPIGEFETKSEVRKKAEEFGLVTSNKKDSQGLCFVGKTPFRELLKQTIGQKEGEIWDINSDKVIGKHSGAFLYTIGQRQQLGLSGGPWFVTSIDVQKNVVFVSNKTFEEKLYSNNIYLSDCNWQIINILKEKTSENLQLLLSKLQIKAQTRYHQNYQKCKVQILDQKSCKVEFVENIKSVAKGQSMVLYSNQIVIGGGIIK
jgi:tRNA-uridine 2-sulfurtransferase